MTEQDKALERCPCCGRPIPWRPYGGGPKPPPPPLVGQRIRNDRYSNARMVAHDMVTVWGYPKDVEKVKNKKYKLPINSEGLIPYINPAVGTIISVRTKKVKKYQRWEARIRWDVWWDDRYKPARPFFDHEQWVAWSKRFIVLSSNDVGFESNWKDEAGRC